MQPVLGDVDLIAEDQFQRLQAVRRRSAAPCGDATAALSTARRLRRPVAAAARRGCGRVVRRPGRSLRPARGRSCARSRETPTGRPTARSASSRKTLLPCSRGRFCSGSAIRLPNPPCGIVSWFGKRRSYESSPMSGRRSIVSVRRCDPSLRASAAGMASSKKSQTCPPRPERDRSSAAGRSRRRQRLEKRRGILAPAGLVEVDGEEEARLVQEHRVDARDEGLPVVVVAGQVPANDVVGHRKEPTMWDTRRT